MHRDKAIGIVVVPNWQTQPFYATLMKILIDYPIFIKKRPSLITLPGENICTQHMGQTGLVSVPLIRRSV